MTKHIEKMKASAIDLATKDGSDALEKAKKDLG
jgi:hypothetical protein